MKTFTWMKHGITIAAVASLIAGVFQLMSLNVESDNFGEKILSSTFFLFLFVVVAVYRIGLIGREKMDWISTFFALLSGISLVIMLITPMNIMALWKPSAAVFVILVGYTFYQKLNRKNWSQNLSKVLLIITCLSFLYPLLVKTGSSFYYSISWYFLAATTILASLNTALPEKQG